MVYHNIVGARIAPPINTEAGAKALAFKLNASMRARR
jgi:hypothetical protein